MIFHKNVLLVAFYLTSYNKYRFIITVLMKRSRQLHYLSISTYLLNHCMIHPVHSADAHQGVLHY